jgi:hypothetical protein
VKEGAKEGAKGESAKEVVAKEGAKESGKEAEKIDSTKPVTQKQSGGKVRKTRKNKRSVVSNNDIKIAVL